MTPLPPLTAHLGYWLRSVSNAVSQGFARKLEDERVTVAEWVVLRELWDEAAVAPSRLAERMGMTRGAISKLAERLIGKGLVARRDSPDDGRAHTLSLTEPGRALIPRLAALADRNDAEFFGHLAPDQRAALEGLLRDFVQRRGLTGVPTE